ncbi:MAG: DUF979 domain-containing protein [Gemmatimonadaceae bacterium]|nr:DUF979 domain-containing protein [Gemmatimonadaceae bacterium]
MITLEFLYRLMGLLTGATAVINFRDRTNPNRRANAAFWGLWSLSFLFGTWLPDLANGVLILAMVAVASLRGVKSGGAEGSTLAERTASARTWGNRLFLPALAVPALTLLANATIGHITIGGAPLVDAKQVTLVSLGVATILSLAFGLVMLRPPLAAPLSEARRLLDAVGWAAMLPQLLAALGAVFAAAGVGKVVSTLAASAIPGGAPLLPVVAYTVGMALLTMLMGNAFAAFPVMTLGIALPLLVTQLHGDPTIIAAIGMLSGFCGTLMTPMAANFNLVPVALLELPDRYAVIRVQVPTALLLLTVNTLLLYFLAFPH